MASAAIRQNGGQALAFEADVSNAQQVSAMFDAAQGSFGGVDIVVNSAGIMKLAPLAASEGPGSTLDSIKAAFPMDDAQANWTGQL